MDQQELQRILEAQTISKTFVCDPEYVVIGWFKKVRNFLCGKKSN